MRIFALILLPFLFLANIGMEFYYNGLDMPYEVSDLVRWRLISIVGREIFALSGLLLMLYFGTFRRTFLAGFSLFGPMVMAAGLLVKIMHWENGAQAIFAGACIIVITYSPHFNNKGKSKIFLDWLKYSFVISFAADAALKLYLSDLPFSVGMVDKIVKLVLFFMFAVFYVRLLKMNPKPEGDFTSIDNTGDSIFADNSNHKAI